MTEVDKKFALMLCSIAGVGDIKAGRILRYFKNHDQFCSAIDDSMMAECGITEKIKNAIIGFKEWQKIETEIARVESLEGKIVCLGDSSYPEILTHISSPPPIIFVKGEPAVLGRPAVAIVGTRTPTPYGRQMTERISAGLAARGMVIVSGLAWGIDTEAHKAALGAGGVTVAVFGSGLDIIYPPENKELARRIADRGCIVSEFPLGTPPEKFNFPRRNRIISGLSRAVVVVEAAAKSGALVTADLALDQGREVFAVPGPADSTFSAGTINLLKKGAAAVTCAEDILDALGWQTDKQAEAKVAAINLDAEEQKLCDIVGMGPTHFDELVRRLGASPSRISAVLLKLELAGLICRRPGNYVARA